MKTSKYYQLQLQEQADVLLFAEAMTGEHSQIARLSFSTKLTDYFHSGKCIFAVGAENVAPMEYLRSENAALCASTEAEIYEVLKTMVENPLLITESGENTYACGVRNHSREKIEQKVQRTLENVLKL